MNNLLFKKWNDFSGWIVFLIAAFVYGMTIEPTASFWDCPEFISCAEKLQVGHPPGAPFYMLVGNLFTQFASEASQVSWLVNFLNALLSAGCILFLFWSITRLVRSLIINEEQNLSTMDVIVILGSGFVGALAYTFSDTFWFSAVEGEVYAFSSFLTALVFWMILRWQDESDSVYGDRWIILIAYIIGLSIGVHLLNLLCIPAIVLVFYYQKYHAISFKGVAAAIVISGLLIVFILFVYIPGIADMGGWFELLFVNVFGLPFHTGLIVFLALTFLVLVGAIYRFRKRMLHTSLWCLLMLTVGYTTYAVILIRANANTPLNENAPDNIFTLKSYLNREQYESAPLLYGKTYASEPEYVPEGDYYRVKTTKGSAVYRPDKEKGKYKIIRYKEDVCYTQNMLFPRMWNERMAASYFCNGDNDTFPLWYNQDTEEVRRDARVCNLSYAQTDWYIYQQQCPLYNAPGLPISWNKNQYQEGTNEYVAVRPELKKQIEELYRKHPEEARDSFGEDPFEVKNILKYWVLSEKPEFHVIPTDTINIHIDKDALLRSGIMLPKTIRHLKGEDLKDAIPDKLYIPLTDIRMLTKVDLLMLEMLANCNWERPLYLAISVGSVSKLKFDNYFVQEGLAFRFTPFDYKKWGDVGENRLYAVDVERLYDNVMNRYKYGGLDTPGLYLDETTLRTCWYHRRLFAQLAKELIAQGDNERAKKVLAYAEQVIPGYNVPETHESGSYDIATAYAALGEKTKAVTLAVHLIAEAEDYINWAFSLKGNRIEMVRNDCIYKFWQWNQYNELLKKIDGEKYKESNRQFEEKYALFAPTMNYKN